MIHYVNKSSTLDEKQSTQRKSPCKFIQSRVPRITTTANYPQTISPLLNTLNSSTSA